MVTRSKTQRLVIVAAFVWATYIWGPGLSAANAQSAGSNGSDAESNQPASPLSVGPGDIEELGYVPPEEDPWESFNEKMFNFNRKVDRYFLKPVATGYDKVLPDPVQIGIRNAINNIDFPRRLVNNLLQAKLVGAGRELARFTINSTVGVAGLVDVAKLGLGLDPSNEDFGQTFGVWGIGPGPYLVLPFLSVMTVRDGIGSIFDRGLNPLTYVSIFVDGAQFVSMGTFTLNAVNERSLNLDTYEQIEETVIDLYSAVRNGYLQSRAASIKE